jgi:alkylated DNA repair dioxygenase AlkB
MDREPYSFEQIRLWSELQPPDETALEAIQILDGDIVLCRKLFSGEESDRLYTDLDQTTQWRKDSIKIYGKSIPLPRLTAWYGDARKSYTYSGIEMHPMSWTNALQEVKSRAEDVARVTFNSVLLNKYRNGQDGVAWHSDDEPELGQNPVIASVSFGETRRFALKHKYQKDLDKVVIDLTHGSLLLMQGTTQHFWLHQIPKTSKKVKPRINLTFRNVN